MWSIELEKETTKGFFARLVGYFAEGGLAIGLTGKASLTRQASFWEIANDEEVAGGVLTESKCKILEHPKTPPSIFVEEYPRTDDTRTLIRPRCMPCSLSARGLRGVKQIRDHGTFEEGLKRINGYMDTWKSRT